MQNLLDSRPTLTWALPLLTICLTACGGSDSGQPIEPPRPVPEVNSADEQQAPAPEPLTEPTTEQPVEPEPETEPATNQPPEFGGQSEFSVAENEQAGVIQIHVSDADDDALTLSMAGADAGLFNFDQDNRTVVFELLPDFEQPADRDSDNQYQFVIEASDGESTAARIFSLSVENQVDTILEERGGLVLTGTSTVQGDEILAGLAMVSVGDIDDDRHDDIAISLPSASVSGAFSAEGQILLIPGERVLGLSEPVVSLAELADSVLSIEGDAGELSGMSLTVLDTDRDDHKELLIASPFDGNSGRIDRISDEVLADRLHSAAGEYRLRIGSSQPEKDTLVLDASDTRNQTLGSLVLPAGDIDQDGIGDLLVCDENTQRNGLDAVGRAYVVFGNSLAGNDSELLDLDSLSVNGGAVVINGEGRQSFERLCSNAASAGDVNGDGFDDLLLVAAANDGVSNRPRLVFLVSGLLISAAAEQQIEINLFTAVAVSEGQILRFVPELGEGTSGLAVVGDHDFNGDGLADFMIGDAEALSGSGAAYLVYGSETFFTPVMTEISLADFSGLNLGVLIQGLPDSEGFGERIAYGEDVIGDKRMEILFTARETGADHSMLLVLPAAALLGQTEVAAGDIGGELGGLVIRGITDRSTLVHAVAGGDVDDDLLQEVLIGAPNARDELGQVYLLTGKLIRDTIAQAQAAGKEAELDLRALFPELSDF